MGTWLLLISVVFYGSSGKYAPPWEKHPNEVYDDASNLFDSAMEICKAKREGKDTSKQQAEYKRQLSDFEENG